MKTKTHPLAALLAGASLLLTAIFADARTYGVSSSPAGRGTKYTSDRGGSAYVGPRGVVAQGADGRTAAAGRRGAAYAGPNGAAVAGRYGAAAVGPNGGVVATRPIYPPPVVVQKTTVVVAPLPVGYIRVVPVGYSTVVYRGYSCRYVGGIYYRPVFYGGTTVYVVVR